MSSEKYKDYTNNVIDKEEDNKYFILIYELNIKEKQEIIKKLKENGFSFDGDKDYKDDVIRMFGKQFVK